MHSNRLVEARCSSPGRDQRRKTGVCSRAICPANHSISLGISMDAGWACDRTDGSHHRWQSSTARSCAGISRRRGAMDAAELSQSRRGDDNRVHRHGINRRRPRCLARSRNDPRRTVWSMGPVFYSGVCHWQPLRTAERWRRLPRQSVRSGSLYQSSDQSPALTWSRPRLECLTRVIRGRFRFVDFGQIRWPDRVRPIRQPPGSSDQSATTTSDTPTSRLCERTGCVELGRESPTPIVSQDT